MRTFAEPEAFLIYIKANSVKLAIVDIWMKPMTGMELLAHLCAYSPQTRVIFITGRKDNTAKMIVMQAGAFGFFVKPFEDDEFLASVHHVLDDAVSNNQQPPASRPKPVGTSLATEMAKAWRRRERI